MSPADISCESSSIWHPFLFATQKCVEKAIKVTKEKPTKQSAEEY
jgi:hypothetical protein